MAVTACVPVKTFFIRLTFVNSILLDQEMASNDFSLSSSSDSEVSELKDYELEVEGSMNSSSIASDEEGTQEACADDPKWKERDMDSKYSLLQNKNENKTSLATKGT